MTEEKIVYEIKLSKPLFVVAIIAAVGLVLIGIRPIIGVTPAGASNDVSKIALCNSSGSFCMDRRHLIN